MPTALALYGAASARATDQIIRAYSTSFGAATRLLGNRHRQHVRNIYGLVRIADELVDGVAEQACLSNSQQLQRLDALEAETRLAMESGYSSNPVVHAFAVTARASGIDSTLTTPFFTSMRMDLHGSSDTAGSSTEEIGGVLTFDKAAHSDYVYGSAEVVGLMCLRVFVRDEALTTEESLALEQGAKNLGAAFQNVNFLRDLADDTDRLARNYLSGGEELTESVKSRWVDTIRHQLSQAEAVLYLLPRDARTAVDCARRLFSRLTDKVEATPIEQLLKRRVRVSDPTKALLIVQSFAASRKRGTL